MNKSSVTFSITFEHYAFVDTDNYKTFIIIYNLKYKHSARSLAFRVTSESARKLAESKMMAYSVFFSTLFNIIIIDSR